MGLASRLVGLTAKIGLDLLIGSTRTDEAITLLSEWFASRTADEQATEVAAALATNSTSVRAAIELAAADAAKTLTPQQLDELSLSVSAGLNDLVVGEPNPAELVEHLNSRRGRYIVWLDLQSVFGNESGRYVHFSWDGEGYRIRDYIGGRIFHPPGPRVFEDELTSVELPMTALAIWQASRGRIQCLDRYGLYFRVDERERWVKVLQLLTETGRQWQRTLPGVA